MSGLTRHAINVRFTVFIFFLFQSLSNVLWAQESDSSKFQKGTYSLSGSILYSQTTFPNSEQTSSNVSLSALYLHFTSSRFAFGGQLSYLYSKNSSGGLVSEVTTFGIGPQFRYYIIANPLNAFLAFSLMVTSGSSTFFGTTIKTPRASFASIDLGCSLFLSRTLALEPFVQYQFNLSGGSSSGTTTTLGISLAHFVFDK